VRKRGEKAHVRVKAARQKPRCLMERTSISCDPEGGSILLSSEGRALVVSGAEPSARP
jgi:hypothetical protein